MPGTGPYSRVYHSIADDERFATILDDDVALAAWLRLLMRADRDWPRSPDVPASVKPRALAKLVAAGLVDRVPGGRYRIHGLDTERRRRSAKGKAAADARWSAPSIAASSPNGHA